MSVDYLLLNQLIEQVYAAAIDPDQWFELLSMLAVLVDSSLMPQRTENDLAHTHSVPTQSLSVSIDAVLKQIPSTGNAGDTQDALLHTPEQVSVLLLRHFMQALRVTQQLQETGDRYDFVLSMLDYFPVALFLVDSEAHLQQTNVYGNEMLQKSNIFQLKSGRLGIRNAAANKQLLDNIRHSIEEQNSTPAFHSQVILGEGAKREDMMAKFLPTRIDGEPYVAILVSFRHSQLLPGKEILRELYGLTTKEIEVAEALVKGLGINEIARRCNVSENTVRTHVKNLFQKTNTNRQGELVSTMLTGPAGIFSNNFSFYNDDKSDQAVAVSYDESKIMTLEDGRLLSYRVTGPAEGYPIFFCHSIPGNSLEVPDNIITLCDRYNIRFITCDRPGYCLSTQDRKFSLLGWTNDLAQLADHLKVETFTVMGYAGGGTFSLAASYSFPTRIREAVLISYGDTPELNTELEGINSLYKYSQRLSCYFPGVLKLFLRILMRGLKSNPEKVVEKLCENLNDNERRFVKSQRYQCILRQLSNINPAETASAMARDLEVYLQLHPWGFDVSEISVPILMFHGLNDRHVNYKTGRRLHDKLPASRFIDVPGAGHYFFFCDFELILKELNLAKES